MPMYAIDVGNLDQLKIKYGEKVIAKGFRYIKKLNPSVIFKPKRYTMTSP